MGTRPSFGNPNDGQILFWLSILPMQQGDGSSVICCKGGDRLKNDIEGALQARWQGRYLYRGYGFSVVFPGRKDYFPLAKRVLSMREKNVFPEGKDWEQRSVKDFVTLLNGRGKR